MDRNFKRLLVQGATALLCLFTPVYGQCPGETIDCQRCGYGMCIWGGNGSTVSYGTVTSVICWPTGNSCVCSSEVALQWYALCDGQQYSGSGHICCA